ncbi:GM12489 [Drosophila sechellia]|uniref:GM12489 n=1 Tax=Drosophila sechellia TaxID=7238 RepID=B4I0A9_DROSE|nr:GM12489 [Drosophila sechellia]
MDMGMGVDMGMGMGMGIRIRMEIGRDVSPAAAASRVVMAGISEVRIRPRLVPILIIVFLVVLMMVHRNGKRTCQGPEYLQAMFVQGDTLPTIYAGPPTAGLEKRSTLLNIKTPSEFKMKGWGPCLD